MTEETRQALAFFADLFAQNARDYEAKWLPIQVNEESRAWVRGGIAAWSDAAKLIREVKIEMPAPRLKAARGKSSALGADTGAEGD